MNRIGGFNTYQSLFESKLKNPKEAEKTKNSKTDKTKKKEPVQLSERAKKLLQQLQKTYGNMDFIVADYDTEEEAAAYLSRGTKEYSVLIEPELLEEMAADQETKEKYMGIIENATSQLNEIKNQLGEKDGQVTRLGISIDKDGNVSYFAELEKISESRQEQIEKTRESRREEKASSEKRKRARVSADSIEELLKKIQDIDWNALKAETGDSGSRFDYSI
ncbi:MAG: hypothetical protein J1F02_01300 [Lachnospiraceae bacterium]|nr:hypothetical protein [Lachnospiraceae bacterium]